MLDYIIEKNKLMPTFESFGITRNDVTFVKVEKHFSYSMKVSYEFVKELIYGPLQKVDEGDYPYVGRGPEKFFLYEIVANKISSVDVDKVNSRMEGQIL